jgi:hypothetical protein
MRFGCTHPTPERAPTQNLPPFPTFRASRETLLVLILASAELERCRHREW